MARRQLDPLIQALVDVRHAQGLTVRGLANLTGLSGSTIYGWESGHHEPRYAELRRWAAGLGLTLTIAAKGTENARG